MTVPRTTKHWCHRKAGGGTKKQPSRRKNGGNLLRLAWKHLTRKSFFRSKEYQALVRSLRNQLAAAARAARSRKVQASAKKNPHNPSPNPQPIWKKEEESRAFPTYSDLANQAVQKQQEMDEREARIKEEFEQSIQGFLRGEITQEQLEHELEKLKSEISLGLFSNLFDQVLAAEKVKIHQYEEEKIKLIENERRMLHKSNQFTITKRMIEFEIDDLRKNKITEQQFEKNIQKYLEELDPTNNPGYESIASQYLEEVMEMINNKYSHIRSPTNVSVEKVQHIDN